MAPPPILTHPHQHLISISPILLTTLSLLLFTHLLPPVIQSTSLQCPATTSGNTLYQIRYFLSVFSSEFMTTPLSTAFMTSLLCFISALITISHVEASRAYNQHAKIITHPTLSWLLLNVATGAVIAPGILYTHIRKHREHILSLSRRDDSSSSSGSEDEEEEEEDQTTTSRGTEPVPPLPQVNRGLLLTERIYSIPIAVLGGFVLPSLLLLINPSPLIAGLWNLFPLVVFRVNWMVLRGLRKEKSRDVHVHVERNTRAIVRVC
ncbi:hypothetical protein QBC38DRAFT_491791 [Podospora fimiseda]|uniref:Uncharacterized protein n=1 Tax=Podospora fimiseda TaxID=252190 RepID=A0AAN6YPI3_9PEZI|nr:hypothetical protein QBC38DRAFT_491791 [Podospora fimiseda]